MANVLTPAGGIFRPPRGGRRKCRDGSSRPACHFYPHLREEGDQAAGRLDPHPEISIHALREEGDDVFTVLSITDNRISIHALREEGDPQRAHGRHLGHISIHALREEGDDRPAEFEADGQIFLSTPSARRATGQLCRTPPIRHISIHALREEGDNR